MKSALRIHTYFLRAIDTLIRMRKCGHPQVKTYSRYCHDLGEQASQALITAMLLDGYDFRYLVEKSFVTSCLHGYKTPT